MVQEGPTHLWEVLRLGQESRDHLHAKRKGKGSRSCNVGGGANNLSLGEFGLFRSEVQTFGGRLGGGKVRESTNFFNKGLSVCIRGARQNRREPQRNQGG